MAYEFTWEEVKEIAVTIADKIDGFSAGKKALLEAEVYCQVPPKVEDVYGALTKTLRLLWAAHRAAKSLDEVAGLGAETTETIGSISAGRNQPVNNPQADEAHLETTWGRDYQYYIDQFGERNISSFGIYSNGRLQGFGRAPGCS